MTTATIPTWTLADRIRKARAYAGIDQAELAARVGVARQTIANYETGATHPTTARLNLMASACGVDATWLRTGATQDGALGAWKLPPNGIGWLGPPRAA